MPVSTEECRAIIDMLNNNPNSYLYRIIFGTKNITMVSSLFFKLLTLIFIFQQTILPEYSDCLLTLLVFYLFFLIAVEDNFVFHVFSLLAHSISLYKRFHTKSQLLKLFSNIEHYFELFSWTYFKSFTT